ncbi:hypothetical protein [Nostocoides sp. F2B08]|uniref:hypothetical protein n=1 Tax=Nostocoides sp. F2B08 TaxID=2653936 RepID=UPI00186AD719|nr:hypothetical protein [Tetrasphaera sp. F2B08]
MSGRWLTALGIILGAAYAAVWGWALSSQTYNIYGALAIIPVVVAIDLLLVAWVVTRNNDESWLPWVLVGGLFAKLLGTFGRYYVAYVVYSGSADAERYNLYAAYQHKIWRQGDIVWEWGGKQGTQVMEIITTAVYTVIGGSPLAGFFVFGSFAFWGAYLLYRAFRVAIPQGDHKRYALLIFFLPSMLYWPSSIGKESWLLLFVGVTALGAARHFTGKGGVIWLLVVGAVGLALVRPHIAVLLFASLFVAEMFRPTGGTAAGLLRKMSAIAVLGAAGVVLVRASAQFLGIDDLSTQAITETIDWSSGQTQQGGSEFTPMPLSNPFGVPVALITILFRPFPFEAGNAQMLVQSLEGMFLLALAVLGWRRLGQIGALRRNPYLVFTIVFILAFVIAFAGFGNFGILARQRVLMLPFFLVLLSLPKPNVSLDGLPLRSGTVHTLPGSEPYAVVRR